MDFKEYLSSLIAAGIPAEALADCIKAYPFEQRPAPAESIQTAAPAASAESIQTAAPAAPAEPIQTAAPAAPAEPIQAAAPATPTLDLEPLSNLLDGFTKQVESLNSKVDSLVGYAEPPTTEELANEAIASVLYAENFKI